MVRALRVALLVLLLGALPYPISAADPLDVSFEVTRVTPTSATIRATISGATGPIQVTARVDPYRGTPRPAVQGLQVQAVEKVAQYRHTPETETVLVPIDEKIAALEAEVAALVKAPIVKGEDTTLREEAIDGKATEFAALSEAQDLGATHVPQEVVRAHRYDLTYKERLVPVIATTEGATIVLAAQSWAEPPPSQLVSDTELAVKEMTVNWGDGVSVYEYTVSTDSMYDSDGWGTSGILVLTINGRDYYDDTHSSWWDAAWPYRMKLTIDNSASTENLIDFPMMVKLTPERFDYSLAQVDGDDIRFVDPDGTALDYECDTWELDGDSWFWVRVPQIDALSTTDYIWMYWGTAAVGNGENAEGVWNDGYVAVYHMNDNPADSTQILDSTANGNTGTKGAGAAAPTEVAGSVGRAQSFVKEQNKTITIAHNEGLRCGSQQTVMALCSWVSGGDSVYFRLLAKGTPYAVNGEWGLMPRFITTGTRHVVYAAYRDPTNTTWHSSTSYENNVDLADGDWKLLSSTWDEGDVVLRRGSTVVDADTAAFTSVYQGTSTVVIGGAQDMVIDELRLSSVAQSAEWIEAEYLSMWDSMLTYGDAEDMPEETEDVPVVAVATSLLVVAVALAAVKQKHIILYLASFILLLFLGFDTFDASLPLAVMVFMFAGFMLYSMSTWFWRHA